MNRFLLVLVALVAGGVAPARAAEPPCQFTDVDRIVAVGDVHGAFERFLDILQLAGVVDGQGRWNGGRTHLVQLGDVVDRGSDSAKALDLLRRLQTEARLAGGMVHPLLGNHEAMRVLGDLRYVTPGEYAAFVTAGSTQVRDESVEAAAPDPHLEQRPPGFVEMRSAFGPEGGYGGWLRTLNAVVQIDSILFLHGGISPAVASLSCEEINGAIRRELTDDIATTRVDSGVALSARADGPLWYRGLAEEPDAFATVVDGILASQGVRSIVIAHTITPDRRVRVRFGGKVVQIDTGMQPDYVRDGRASALEITRAAMTAIYSDRREVLVDFAAPSIPAGTGR